MRAHYAIQIVLFLVLRLLVHSKTVLIDRFEVTFGAVEHCPAVRADIVLLKSCSRQELGSTRFTSEHGRRGTLPFEPHCGKISCLQQRTRAVSS